MDVDVVRMVRDHLDEGRSVCPFAAKRVSRYATDADDLAPLLAGLERGGAAVIVATRTPATFTDTLAWARGTFMRTLGVAARLSYPELEEHVLLPMLAETEAVLRDDSSPGRPMIALRERALLTICMAPIYPPSHPRFLPAAALVLVHLEDLGLGLPQVREVMQREHGSLYDANELVLPLPEAPAER